MNFLRRIGHVYICVMAIPVVLLLFPVAFIGVVALLLLAPGFFVWRYADKHIDEELQTHDCFPI
jgi:hypothetical protein